MQVRLIPQFQLPHLLLLPKPNPPVGLPSIELSGEELPDDVATRYMYDLSSRDRELGAAALEAVLDAQDERFISVLIEVMRGTEVGIFLGIDYDTNVSALESLSGESFGANWPAWVRMVWSDRSDASTGFYRMERRRAQLHRPSFR